MDGLTNGQEYSFRVSAVNAAGTGAVSQTVSEIPATTSQRPNGLIVSTISSTQIDLSWNAPGDTGGSPIIGYRIDRSVESGVYDTIVPNSMSLSTSYSDTNLLRGLDYSYRIYAITTAGIGESSGISRATTFDVSQPATGLSIGATATSLQLSWSAPTETGGTPITGYVVERMVVGGEFEVLVADTASTATLYLDSGLPNDTTYTYRVSVINAAGTSNVSDTEIESTLGSPSAPLGLESHAGKGKVQLKWGTPFSDGGEDITDYIVEYKVKTATTWTTFVDGVGTDLIVLIENTNSNTYLTNNVEYSFRVSAVNAIGTGDVSTVVDAKPSIPGATAAYSLSEIGGGQDVFLPHNEEASLENGGKMTGVKIKPKDKLDSFSMTSTFLKDAPTGVDGDKLGADMYIKFELDFVVQSEISSTAPGAPTGVSVTSSIPNQVSISWNAPSDDGGADISGYKIERSSTPRNSSTQSTWTILTADTKSTSTSYTDGGLTNGDTYHYRVSAINSAGTSTASGESSATPINVPGAPLSVAVTSVGDATVSLSWSIPTVTINGVVTTDDGGSDITDYVVEFDDGSGWETFDEGVGVGTTATVTGLTNGDNYSFRIFASNAKGTIYPSLLVSEVPSTVTTVPRSLTTSVASATQIDLSWNTPASDGGSPIVGYQIERKVGTPDSSASWSTLVSDTGNTATTYSDGDTDGTRLFGGTTYSYRVSAINGGGTGSASNIAQGITHSVPDAPTGVTAVALPSKYIISWTPPVNDGGRAIFDYIIQYSTDSGTTWKTIRDNVDANTSYSVSGSSVVNGQTYTLRVFAVNLVGTGSASTTFDVKPVSVPQAPRSLDTTPATGQITLNWVAPLSDGGEAITAYNIISEIEDADGTYSVITPTITHVSPTATTAVVSGITDGNKYKFQVSATSSVGTGPASIPSIETVGELTSEHDDETFDSIEVTFLLGDTGDSTHPTVPNNSHADAAPGFVCPAANVYFITDGGDTVFDNITIVRAPDGDTATQCAYTASLPHFSTYGINIQVDSKFAVGAAGLAVGGVANAPIPPIITGLAMYSFGAPTLNEDGQLVFAKTGSYQSLPEYSQTLPTTTLKIGEPSQIAVRLFDYNGPDAVEHVGLYLNLHGIAYETEDSDTYIIYDKGEDFTVVDPHGLLSNVNVTPRVENEILWLLFDMTFEEMMDTSTINVNAWNVHRARAETVAYEILKVSDIIPELEKITGATDSGAAAGGSGSVDDSFYIVESVTETCDVCYSPFDITLNENEIEWTNLDESIRTIISGDPISGFDGFFKSNFIFQDNSYSTAIENTGYYSMYDLLEEQYHSAMVVEVSGDPISDARLLEKPTMPFDHTATKIVSGSSSGAFGLDVSLPGTVQIFGDVYNVDTRQAVLIDITQPDGTMVYLKFSTGSEGHFSTVQTIPDDWEDGLYTVSFGITEQHISSIYFKLISGKILPLFTPSTSVVADAEIVAEIATSELTLLHTSTLGHGGNLLIAEGQVDSSYSRVVVSIENPDGTVDEYEMVLNAKDKYSLPLIRDNWLVGDYTVTISDESVEFASESFTIKEPEVTKSALEMAFESSKEDAPIILENVKTEVILLESDYFEQIDEFSGESEYGTVNVIRPDTKLAQSTLNIFGTVTRTTLEGISNLVEMTLTRPDGHLEQLTTILTKDGNYETILVESWVSGDYTLHVSHEGNTISELTFYIGEITSDASSSDSCPTSNCASVESDDELLSSPVMITIDGNFENIDSGIPIDVKIIRPDNTSVDLSATLTSAGEFESPLIHSEQWIPGVYTVIVSYNGEQLSAASFRK